MAFSPIIASPLRSVNTRSVSFILGSRLSSATACGDNGMRCALPAFMRPAGIVQVAPFKSISDQRAPRLSPVRVAVKIKSSSARAGVVGNARSRFTKSATLA
jgi:hypothetical protein